MFLPQFPTLITGTVLLFLLCISNLFPFLVKTDILEKKSYKSLKHLMRSLESESSSSMNIKKWKNKMREDLKNPRAIIFFSEYSNILDIVIPATIMRKAGMNVRVGHVGNFLNSIYVKNDFWMIPDIDLVAASTYKPFELVLLAGGDGHKNLSQSTELRSFLYKHIDEGKHIAAIGTGILALFEFRIGYLKEVTCPPEYIYYLGKHFTVNELNDFIDDEFLITCRATGDLIDFSFYLAQKFARHGVRKAKEVKKDLGYF